MTFDRSRGVTRTLLSNPMSTDVSRSCKKRSKQMGCCWAIAGTIGGLAPCLNRHESFEPALVNESEALVEADLFHIKGLPNVRRKIPAHRLSHREARSLLACMVFNREYECHIRQNKLRNA